MRLNDERADDESAVMNAPVMNPPVMKCPGTIFYKCIYRPRSYYAFFAKDNQKHNWLCLVSVDFGSLGKGYTCPLQLGKKTFYTCQ